jgi:imidazolonepropionase-like amidohydrolase
MREFLEAGFTTVLSAGDPLEEILELRRQVEEGTITGPRLIVSGRVPLARGPGGFTPGVDPARFDRSRPPNRPTETAIAIPHDQTRATVQELVEAGVDAIKTILLVTPDGPEQETLSVIVEEAERYGIPSITHAVTVQDMVAAVEARTHVLVHTPHIGQLDEDTARIVAESGIPMMSTLGIFVPTFAAENAHIRSRTGDDNVARFRDLDPLPMNILSSAGQGPVNARLLWDAGVTYGYGTDTTFLPKDSLAHELRPLRLVFSAKDIVTIMTRNAATTILRSDEIGSLEPGKLADIVVLDGDPLSDIYDLLNVEVVIKGGRIVVDNR